MIRSSGKHRRVLVYWAILAAVSGQAHAVEPAPPKDTQKETVKLLTPQQALESLTVPDGFSVSLFASEPNVRQPIALATDARGRLWVVENNTYAERDVNFDMSQRDRILILEDTDHDGRADRHTVFWDQGQKLTSVELGCGGVWALCPPHLLFIPDRNGDDVPDAAPRVVLDGWNDTQIRHNIANGLRWGPDGWLYGRHGIQAASLVGPPGATPAQRTALNCAIWRFHPTRKAFEVVCRGTTNPWGMDWNDSGELFFINTVIGHLWHAIPGAHFERMYGEDFNPHLYGLIGQTADHYHWDTAESWDAIRRRGVTSTTDQAGGGHSHCGMMIYLGDNWPEKYRNRVFAINTHGRRINNDTLERRGAGYVGRHAPDFLKSADPWFRGVELITGPDGGVYVADWSDIGECHENDGVHRSSGRIYKVSYGRPARPLIDDVSQLSDDELVALQRGKNEWFVRQGRRILQERAAAGLPMAQVHASLRSMFETDPDPAHKLRAVWALHVTRGASDAWLLTLLHDGDEHIRAWGVRLLGDGKTPSAEAMQAFAALVSGEPSGLVLLYLASALQQVAPAGRWLLAEGLAARSEFATDPVLPLMVWYGIEPAVPEDPARAVRLAGSSLMPIVVRSVARRLTENLKSVPEPVDRLVALASRPGPVDRTRAILTGMAEALRGWRKAPMPPSWPTAQSVLATSPASDVQRLVRELSVVFGDGRALRTLMEIASSKSADLSARRDALRVLIEARSPQVAPLLRQLLRERDLGADAARGLAAFDDPGIARLLLRSFPDLKEPARIATIVTLSSRPASARSLLEAVASGAIDRRWVPAFQVRQMATFPDEDVRRRVTALWPELRAITAAKRGRIDRLKAMLGTSALTAANLSNGRRRFVAACATCHTLFGQGGKVGPDLTGSQRSNLDYLLENIVDPATTLASDYRVSAVALADGRLLNGIIGDPTGPTVTIQTPTERLVVNRSEIEGIRDTDLSLMPEGLLDVLPEREVRDLIAYLMTAQQVPLPTEEAPAAAQ